MGLTNPGWALERFSQLLISVKLSTLSGIPPFFTNSFRLASLLALLVGLNISFLTGVLVWFFKITKVVPFKSVEVFHKDLFLALYFSLYSIMIYRPLCLLPLAALYADDLAIWSSSPSVPTAVEATQGALFRLTSFLIGRLSLLDLLSFTVESTFSTPCSRSDPPSLAKVRLLLTLTLSPS